MGVNFHFCIKIWRAAGGFAEVLGAGWAEDGAKPQPQHTWGRGSRPFPHSGGGTSLGSGKDYRDLFLPCRKAQKDENCHCYSSSVFSNYFKFLIEKPKAFSVNLIKQNTFESKNGGAAEEWVNVSFFGSLMYLGLDIYYNILFII